MSVTYELAHLLVSTRFEDLPEAAVEIARQVCLDGIGVIIAGAREPLGVGRITIEYTRELGGVPEATVIAGNLRTSALNAAYANGTMCHALDFDNTWMPVNHPTSPALPAILALAERERASGRDVLLATVLAFEVQGRMRLATRRIGANSTFHKPGVSGLMGAVAGAGKILGLGAPQFCHAFGVGGSRAGSITVNTGSMTKSSHSGHGARMGVEAALLARRGWTANEDVFGAGKFFETFYGPDAYEPELFLTDFGRPYRMVTPGVGFKKFPANYYTHRPIDAALALRSAHAISGPDIDRVEIDFPEFPHLVRARPKSGLDGKHSVQYATALALLDGKVGIESFSEERRFAPDMESLLGRIKVNMRREIPVDIADTYAIVRVATKDGRVLEERCDVPRGFPGHPLTREERIAKFHDCVAGMLAPEARDRLVGLVERLETCDDIAPVMAIAGHAPAAGA